MMIDQNKYIDSRWVPAGKKFINSHTNMFRKV